MKRLSRYRRHRAAAPLLLIFALLGIGTTFQVAGATTTSPMTAAERKPGEESLYREEKYASVYEINMLRCIFCGFCEEACPKEAIFLDGDIAKAGYKRDEFIFGKDKLVEPIVK